jgi:hypothetical protein
VQAAGAVSATAGEHRAVGINGPPTPTPYSRRPTPAPRPQPTATPTGGHTPWFTPVPRPSP